VIALENRSQLELLRAYHEDRDQAARDQLVEENLPLVRAISRRYAGKGEPLDDLVQVGSIGLIKAIDRFDLDRGVELRTYAVPTIVGEIKRHFRDRGWAVHVPRRMKELNLRLSRLVETLSGDLGRSPTITELAAAAGATDEEVVEALESGHAYSTDPLTVPGDDDADADRLEQLGRIEEGYAIAEDRSVLEHGLGALDERDRRIVELRFIDGLTQSQIAHEIGISQMHVSRLIRRALETMRLALDDEGEE
jgi:RNA polymerase sigma-B factor